MAFDDDEPDDDGVAGRGVSFGSAGTRVGTWCDTAGNEGVEGTDGREGTLGTLGTVGTLGTLGTLGSGGVGTGPMSAIAGCAATIAKPTASTTRRVIP